MKTPKFKRYKDYNFLIIPHFQGYQKRGFVLSSVKLFLIAAGYSVFLFFTFFFLIRIFPSDLSPADYKNNNSEIKSLNEKVIFLTKELESISALNKRLKYAIMLGDSNLIDSIKRVKKAEENKTQEIKKQVGGNLLNIIRYLLKSEDTLNYSAHAYFIKPVVGFVSRNYNTDRGHFGIDYAVKTGTPVVAAESGYVLFADYTAGDGYTIMIMHENKYISVYKHCSELTKKIRDNVVQGETIALSGNTGLNTSGPHLHFEIWYDGQVINPNTVLLK